MQTKKQTGTKLLVHEVKERNYLVMLQSWWLTSVLQPSTVDSETSSGSSGAALHLQVV